MVRVFSIVAAVTVLLGCDTEAWFVVHVEHALAVGATGVGDAAAGSRTYGFGVTQTDRRVVDQTFRKVVIQSVAASAPDLFEVLPLAGAEVFEYRALQPGSATLTIVAVAGLESKTFTEEVSAAVLDRVTAQTPTCSWMDWSSPAPAVHAFPVDFSFPLLVGLYVGRPEGDFYVTRGLPPVSVDVTLGTYSEGQVHTALEPGQGLVTSPMDPTFSFPFAVFSPADILSVSGEASVVGLNARAVSFSLITRVAASGLKARACLDDLERVVRVLTPSSCRIGLPTEMPEDQRSVVGANGVLQLTVIPPQSGPCSLEVTIPGATAPFQVDLNL